MKLYLLSRDNIFTCEYDEYDEKLIRAKTSKEARLIANESTGSEGKIWEDTKKVKVKEIKVTGKSGVIMTSYNAG
jgi:hypothetical protein